jgi:hypothetical protein
MFSRSSKHSRSASPAAISTSYEVVVCRYLSRLFLGEEIGDE